LGCRAIAKKGKVRKVHRTLQQKIIFGLAVYLVLLAAAGAAYLGWRLAAPPPVSAGGPAQRLDAALLDELMRELAAAQDGAPGPVPAPAPFYPLTGTAGTPPAQGAAAPPAQAAPQGEGAPAAPMGASAPAALQDLPAGQVAELGKKVSAADRVKVTSILLRRLSSSDINNLAGMARGGLTPEEKKAARELLAARLTPQEWAELQALYGKYR